MRLFMYMLGNYVKMSACKARKRRSTKAHDHLGRVSASPYLCLKPKFNYNSLAQHTSYTQHNLSSNAIQRKANTNKAVDFLRASFSRSVSPALRHHNRSSACAGRVFASRLMSPILPQAQSKPTSKATRQVYLYLPAAISLLDNCYHSGAAHTRSYYP